MRQFITGLAAVALLSIPVLAHAQKPKTGAEVFATCTACHQATGLGLPGAFPPLVGSEWVIGKPEVPIAIVLHGMQGEITVKGAKYDQMMMPWGAMFTSVGSRQRRDIYPVAVGQQCARRDRGAGNRNACCDESTENAVDRYRIEEAVSMMSDVRRERATPPEK